MRISGVSCERTPPRLGEAPKQPAGRVDGAGMGLTLQFMWRYQICHQEPSSDDSRKLRPTWRF